MIASGSMNAFPRDRELRDAMWLALIPIGAALVLGLLLLPRRAPPDSVPLPIVDARALARTVAAESDLAEQARQRPLPGAVRALGSAMRDFHSLEASDASESQLREARRKVSDTLDGALIEGDASLLELRAIQLEGFVAEVRRFESTGEQSPELAALAGSFVRAMTTEGWCTGHVLAPPEPALRTLYKRMWNALLDLESRPGFAPTLDEARALYAFYLSRPHISRGMRAALEAARRGARNERECSAIAEAERHAVDAWRLDHVKSLVTIDPAYPGDYALGVASYRSGDYNASAAAFRRWLESHPEGPLALRARNFLRAAANAQRVE
jgi:TolA-binding protein